MELKTYITKIESNSGGLNSLIIRKLIAFIKIACGVTIGRDKRTLTTVETTSDGKHIAYIECECSEEAYDLFKQFVRQRGQFLETITFDYKY